MGLIEYTEWRINVLIQTCIFIIAKPWSSSNHKSILFLKPIRSYTGMFTLCGEESNRQAGPVGELTTTHSLIYSSHERYNLIHLISKQKLKRSLLCWINFAILDVMWCTMVYFVNKTIWLQRFYLINKVMSYCYIY